MIVPADAGHIFAMAAAFPALRLTATRRLYADQRLPVNLELASLVCSEEAYALFETTDMPVPFAVVGSALLPTGEAEIWFLVRPGGLAPALLLAVIRFARVRLRLRPAICTVEPGNSSGERLATLIGFQDTGRKIGHRAEWRLVNGFAGQQAARHGQ